MPFLWSDDDLVRRLFLWRCKGGVLLQWIYLNGIQHILKIWVPWIKELLLVLGFDALIIQLWMGLLCVKDNVVVIVVLCLFRIGLWLFAWARERWFLTTSFQRHSRQVWAFIELLFWKHFDFTPLLRLRRLWLRNFFCWLLRKLGLLTVLFRIVLLLVAKFDPLVNWIVSVGLLLLSNLH